MPDVLYVTINGKEYKVGKLSDNNATLTMRNVKESLTIESARVVTVKKLALDVSRCSWTDYAVTLVFNQPVDPATTKAGITASTLAAGNVIDEIFVEGDTVTVTMKNGTGPLVVSNTLTLANSIEAVAKTDAGTDIKFAAGTATLAASGTVTFA